MVGYVSSLECTMRFHHHYIEAYVSRFPFFVANPSEINSKARKSVWKKTHMCGKKLTPQSLRLPLKKWWLEDYFPIGKLNFSGENSLLNFERVNSRSQSHQFHPTLTHWPRKLFWFNKFSTVQPSEFFTAQQGQFQVPNTVRSWEPRESGFRVGKFFHL